ncbi:DUF4214 domain-containing protein [Rhizobium sp. YJ-22]|uniref:DUF4214 domain-containing protein n=1 Tax=Rhizobium sp. YJ-22 TaxID=3037556 RepID=UPI002412ABA8|nr:DUF4214 domain-containing protein [Rhizobium sp. YJ-22]MDG3580204.1 DUF4214 domain-containing protein [Rhizobium sp. YJ-22]
MATIQGVYVALFGRPADPTGLAYFNSVTKNGADLNGIGDLASTQEYKDRFAGQNNTQIVNSIYQSLFGRDAEAAGLTFFVNALNNGTLNIKNIAIAILDGAQGSDKTVVTNKVAAADLYTKALDTGPEIVAYSGNAAAAQGRTFLSTVKDTVPTAAAVDTAVAAMVTASNGGGTGTTGVTLTLTNVADFVSPDQANSAFKTTAGNDTIRALAAADFASADSIDGGAGTDTLNAVFVANGSVNPILKSVEVVNLVGPGVGAGVTLTAGAGAAGQSYTFDSAASVGIQQLNLSSVNLTAAATAAGINQGASLNANNIDKSVTVSFKDVVVLAGAAPTDHADLNVNFAAVTGGNDSATVSVNNVNSVVNGVATLNVAGIENLTLNSTGAASSLTVKDAQLQKLVITGDKDIAVLNDAGNAVLKTVDASAFTGTFTYTATGNGETITGSAKADVITLGAGNDTVVYNKAGVSVVGAIDVIKGFAAGTSSTSVDKIDLKAFALGADTTIKTITTTPTADVAGFFDTTNRLAFNDTDKLLYVDVNKDGNFNAATDLVIKLDLVGVANLDKGDFILA